MCTQNTVQAYKKHECHADGGKRAKRALLVTTVGVDQSLDRRQLGLGAVMVDDDGLESHRAGHARVPQRLSCRCLG